MFRSVENEIVSQVFHRTVPLLRNWDETTGELPDEAVFAAFREDILEGRENKSIGKAARRLNFERSGMSSAFRSAPRKLKKVTEPPFKEQIIAINEKVFGDVNTWRLIKRESRRYTTTHFLASIDMRLDDLGSPTLRPENERIYVKIFIRTLVLSAVITGLCLLLGFPIAYLLATLPTKTSNLLLILVLLPFWTSLLVRTSSWIAILQQQGVINQAQLAG